MRARVWFKGTSSKCENYRITRVWNILAQHPGIFVETKQQTAKPGFLFWREQEGSTKGITAQAACARWSCSETRQCLLFQESSCGMTIAFSHSVIPHQHPDKFAGRLCKTCSCLCRCSLPALTAGRKAGMGQPWPHSLALCLPASAAAPAMRAAGYGVWGHTARDIPMAGTSGHGEALA